MPGLVPGIHVLFDGRKDVDGRDKPGHDEQWGKRMSGLRSAFGLIVAFFMFSIGHAQTIPGALPESASALAQGQWPAYAGTYAAARYSPLTQINRDNAKNLRVIWRWKSPDAAIRDAKPEIGPGYVNESTPLMVDSVLYTSTSLSQVAAIDAVTGETKWVFDPKVYENGLGPPANLGWTHRGVAYWRKGNDERIVILTAFAQMIALDAKTGKPVPDFGTNGRVDLNLGLRRPPSPHFYTMTSPPVIVRDVIVVGSSVLDWWGERPSPVGDVRGFDIASGKLKWTFHTVAQGEEPGAETKRFLEGGGQRQCLGADERRRGARLCLSAREHADQRLLWRAPARRRPLW
jgi:quinoprotein glucose dehydrogenase